MAKYLSNRQKNLKIGISSYTENNTVLEVTGKVGIGTTNAKEALDVYGNASVSGIATVDSLNVLGISTLGFFEDDQTLIRDMTLSGNKNYYTVHKNLIIDPNATLTIGSGTTLTLDRLNNLDDVWVYSLGISSGPLMVGGLSNTYTPTNNSEMTFELTSNTNLRIKVRGSDGVLRTANILLS